MCKMVMQRDTADHVHFCPLQSDLGMKLLTECGAPTDVSTAVLIDEEGVHTESSAILRLFPSMGFPWNVLGPAALCVPAFIRNRAYRAFSRHRGSIWKVVKHIMGWGDTMLNEYVDKCPCLAVEPEPWPAGWGYVAVEAHSSPKAE